MINPNLRKFLFISASLASLLLVSVCRADDSALNAPANGAPALVAPARNAPLSTSQTSATPIGETTSEAAAPGFTGWSKPAWLTDLSLGIKESYDDNILRVSGNGLPTESSWVDVISLKLGFNLAPLLAADPGTIQTFSLTYQPDRVTYDQASSENFTAHRVNAVLKGKSGDVSFNVNEAFLYNDGNKLAPTYALNQLSTAAANQNDKYRNSLAHAPARERGNQYQDRYTASLQYDAKSFFVRAVSALNYINMNTYLFNNSLAPYKGYQDWIDRYDVNVGADFGFKLAPNWALTLGYRDGYQFQQRYSEAINSDQHESSNHYQRLLFGVEGKLDWLTFKFSAGPDFRDFNPNTPISDLHTTRFYGEAAVAANFAAGQSITFSYRDYVFVSSTGLVPYEEYSYSLIYHWNATRRLGVDLGGKLFEHNYTLGNDLAGSAPSLRLDLDDELLGGVTYAVTPHFSASVTYAFDDGRNGLDGLAAKYAPSYRNFEEGVISLELQYRF